MNKEDEKDLSELFLEDQNFQKTMRKARRKVIIKNVLITGIILTVLYLTFYIGMQRLLNNNMMKEDIAESRWLYISEPNIQQNGTSYNWGVISGEGDLQYSKKLGDRTIPWETLKGHYSLFGSYKTFWGSDSIYNRETGRWDIYNRQNGQRELAFYHPDIQYKQLPNDLNILEEIHSNKYVEYALSFNRAYSFQEIQSLLDKKDTEWLWIGIQSSAEKDSQSKQAKTGTKQPLERGQIYGYRYNSITNWSSPEFLISELQSPDIKGYKPYAVAAERVLNDLKKENPKLNPEKVKMIGAVITGTPEELKKYQGKEFIRAASIGATIDQY